MHYLDYLNWEYYENILYEEFPYYKLLEPKRKREFIIRLIDVKNNMVFEGQHGFSLNDHNLCLLCASMVQLTFGYADYRFYHFKKIIIVPDIFHSKYIGADVKGLTYAGGYIYLAWNYFYDGYKEYKNKINLGLHEFAHALMIQKVGLLNEEQLKRFKGMFRWMKKEREQKKAELPLFRDYALSNLEEFWAVSVEIFFEQPLEFRHEYPNLYRLMVDALKQDAAQNLRRYLDSK